MSRHTHVPVTAFGNLGWPIGGISQRKRTADFNIKKYLYLNLFFNILLDVEGILK